jgi:hypothetical protein
MSWGASKAAVVGALSGLAVAAAIAATAPVADARANYESPYGYDRTWNAAMRLVRVDNGWKVNEKEESSGYILFDYRSPESSTKVTPGSIEIVKVPGTNGAVSVLVQLPQMPHYHEQVLLDSLTSKMRREYGDPPVRKKAEPAPPSETADAGPE